MACNADLVQYIVEQCSGAGEITVKKMMGDYCIYCDGILFGLVCDNNLYVKPTYQGAAQLKEVVMRSPYPGAKEYFLINDVDDRDYLTAIIKSTITALPKPKAKKNPMFFQQHIGKGFHFKVEFQNNQYVRDFFADNKGASLDDAIRCWHWKKTQPGSHRYERSDLGSSPS